MKTIHSCIGLVLINLFCSFSCYGGSLIVENEYPALRVMAGAIDGRSFGATVARSLHIDAEEFIYSGRIIIYYAPGGDSYTQFKITDTDRFLVVDIEDYFEKPGHHVYHSTTNLNGDIFEIEIEADVTHCTDSDICFIAQRRIQEFRCKVIRAALNGIELPREPRTKAENKELKLLNLEEFRDIFMTSEKDNMDDRYAKFRKRVDKSKKFEAN